MNTTHKEHSKTYNLPIYTVIQFITKQLTQADKLLYIYIYIYYYFCFCFFTWNVQKNRTNLLIWVEGFALCVCTRLRVCKCNHVVPFHHFKSLLAFLYWTVIKWAAIIPLGLLGRHGPAEMTGCGQSCSSVLTGWPGWLIKKKKLCWVYGLGVRSPVCSVIYWGLSLTATRSD